MGHVENWANQNFMYGKLNQGENADEIILCSTSQSNLEYCVRDTLQLSMA